MIILEKSNEKTGYRVTFIFFLYNLAIYIITQYF
nr:MAG TPA: hypothetical protein [Caudoviricetes sp.]